MEQLPNWLAAAVLAAGLSTVYNADDWSRAADVGTSEPAVALPPAIN